MHAHISMYLRYVRMYLHTCIHTYLHMHTCIVHSYVYACIHICKYTYMYVRTYTHAYYMYLVLAYTVKQCGYGVRIYIKYSVMYLCLETMQDVHLIAIIICIHVHALVHMVCACSGTCIIQHPLGNEKQCWISRLLDYRGQFAWKN